MTTEHTSSEHASIYELSSIINEDDVEIVEIVNKLKISHFYEAVNPEIHEKFIAIDNNHFKIPNGDEDIEL